MPQVPSFTQAHETVPSPSLSPFPKMFPIVPEAALFPMVDVPTVYPPVVSYTRAGHEVHIPAACLPIVSTSCALKHIHGRTPLHGTKNIHS